MEKEEDMLKSLKKILKHTTKQRKEELLIGTIFSENFLKMHSNIFVKMIISVIDKISLDFELVIKQDKKERIAKRFLRQLAKLTIKKRQIETNTKR